jgi:hypothetical protein
MITWEQATYKIRQAFMAVLGREPTDKQVTALAALSYVYAGFGYHFDTPGDTDHNWFALGESAAMCGTVGDKDASTAQGCLDCGGRHGKGYHGQPICFDVFPSDEDGLRDALHYIAQHPVINAAATGNIPTLADSCLRAPPSGSGFGATVMYTAFALQFRPDKGIGPLSNALSEAFADYEKKTGKPSGWSMSGGAYLTDRTMGIPTGGGASAPVDTSKTDEDAGMGAWLLGGAIVAVAVGLFYATTKVR